MLFIPDPDPDVLSITDPGSRMQGSKRHRIPDSDPQHWPWVWSLCFQVADKRKRDIAAFLRGLFLLAEEIAHSGMAIVLFLILYLLMHRTRVYI